MSDQPASGVAAEAVQFLKVWAESISQVFGQVSSSTIAVEVAEVPEAADLYHRTMRESWDAISALRCVLVRSRTVSTRARRKRRSAISA